MAMARVGRALGLVVLSAGLAACNQGADAQAGGKPVPNDALGIPMPICWH